MSSSTRPFPALAVFALVAACHQPPPDPEPPESPVPVPRAPADHEQTVAPAQAPLMEPPEGRSTATGQVSGDGTPAGAPSAEETLAVADGELVVRGRGRAGGGEAYGRVHGVGTIAGGQGVGLGASLGRRSRAPSASQPDRFVQIIVDADEPIGTERYEDYGENDWITTARDALATFSIDVDTASYSLIRGDLNAARRPRPEAVRVEEFVNVFDYAYAPPEDLDVPFAVHLEAAPSRFGDGLQLLRVGIQGYETDRADRAPANLVFLVDTSGSMMGPDRLGLVQYSLQVLLAALGPDDTLSIVSYAGRAETVLAPTPVRDRGAIVDAIQRLRAGGSTNGADGIRTAYELASTAFVTGGTNRVIWCSDGDLNVGMTGDALLAFIEENRRRGVALTTLGFGRGNYNDRDMERFADRGDGNYHFIDDRNEALRVLGDELMGTLEVIARDVKIQVELEPDLVESYRLIGYENRDIADADFRNDAVDAGEIGSGHSVTALLELRMRGDRSITRNERVATVRVRYEMPDEEGEGREIAQELWSHQFVPSFDDASASFRLAAAVAEFAEILRGGENTTGADFDAIEAEVRTAQASSDLQVEELAALVTQARALWIGRP